MIAQGHRRERHAHGICLSSRTEPASSEIADQLLEGALDVRLINIRVADTMRRAQSRDDPAQVYPHTKCADPVATIGSRAARADSTGREGHARLVGGLPLTMTRALGLLA
jgi:hypothetical protein